MSDRASPHVYVTVGAPVEAFHQPVPATSGVTAALIVGFVRSTLMGPTLTPPALPATSATVPANVRPPPSAKRWGASHEATPDEPRSAQLKVAVGAPVKVLYQPLKVVVLSSTKV